MKKGINLIAAAFALTALSYGLARFAYGLFLPQIREDLSLSVLAAGWIGGSAFAAYCLGIVIAFIGNGKLSTRTLAVLAGTAATLGMVLVALAASGWALGVGIALAGLSTGLTSPPLATAVAQRFEDKDRAKANTIINAGSAVGIVLSGIAAVMTVDAWREVYALFALIGALISVWLWFTVPAGKSNADNNGFSVSILMRPGVLLLCFSAFLMGMSSTAVWMFGANILRDEFDFKDLQIAWIWITLGLAGASGAVTGLLSKRFGVRRVHCLSLLGMAIGTLGLASAAMSGAYGFVAAGVFGAAYIISTGAYLIQGIDLLADRPDLGLGAPFLMVALGQSVGTPLFGAMLNTLGTLGALAMFASLACLAIVVRARTRANRIPFPRAMNL